MSDLTPVPVSPFDGIRRVRPDRTEYWSARALMKLMSYASWQYFATPLQRAMKTAENQNMDLTSHFMGSHETPSGGGPLREDYELSRPAAYLVAMNGDPNKAEVAAAQAYFAAKTREAEVVAELSPYDFMRYQIDRMELAERTALEAIEVGRGNSARLDAIEGNHDWSTALGFAKFHKIADTSEQTLRNVGARASLLAKPRGIAPVKVRHFRYGTQNSYPDWLWMEAFQDLGIT